MNKELLEENLNRVTKYYNVYINIYRQFTTMIGICEEDEEHPSLIISNIQRIIESGLNPSNKYSDEVCRKLKEHMEFLYYKQYDFFQSIRHRTPFGMAEAIEHLDTRKEKLLSELKESMNNYLEEEVEIIYNS